MHSPPSPLKGELPRGRLVASFFGSSTHYRHRVGPPRGAEPRQRDLLSSPTVPLSHQITTRGTGAVSPWRVSAGSPCPGVRDRTWYKAPGRGEEGRQRHARVQEGQCPTTAPQDEPPSPEGAVAYPWGKGQGGRTEPGQTGECGRQGRAGGRGKEG